MSKPIKIIITVIAGYGLVLLGNLLKLLFYILSPVYGLFVLGIYFIIFFATISLFDSGSMSEKIETLLSILGLLFFTFSPAFIAGILIGFGEELIKLSDTDEKKYDIPS